MLALLRQGVYGRIVSYEDTNDPDYLRMDPAMRGVVGGRAQRKFAASSSEMGRFETKLPATEENLAPLSSLCGRWVDTVHDRTGVNRLVLDMESSESPTYGEQEGSIYNGHFGCTCYSPLFCFNQFGDVEGALLREGNAHSARDWGVVLEPIAQRYCSRRIEKFFRADAAFAEPEVYRYLEQEGYGYAIRLPGNKVLYKAIEHLLKRPVGRPTREPKAFYHSFRYQAGSWDTDRRGMAEVEWHLGELFPRVGFIVTNLTWWSKNAVGFYDQRGMAEQWIKEGKNAVKWTRLSCRQFKDNAVRLQLFVLACNLANFLRRLALPRTILHWSLTTLREKLVKIGAKVARHSRYVIFQLAEVSVPGGLLAAILSRTQRLAPVPTLRKAAGAQGGMAGVTAGDVSLRPRQAALTAQYQALEALQRRVRSRESRAFPALTWLRRRLTMCAIGSKPGRPCRMGDVGYYRSAMRMVTRPDLQSSLLPRCPAGSDA